MDYTTVAAVRSALGLDPTDTTDDDWLAACVDAANAVATTRRATAGYVDTDPALLPAVTLGTTLYAMARYRERGVPDGYSSFGEFGSFVPGGGSWGEIQRLWGVNRPQVDVPPADPVVLAARRRR